MRLPVSASPSLQKAGPEEPQQQQCSHQQQQQEALPCHLAHAAVPVHLNSTQPALLLPATYS